MVTLFYDKSAWRENRIYEKRNRIIDNIDIDIDIINFILDNS